MHAVYKILIEAALDKFNYSKADNYLKDCADQGKSYHDVMPGVFPFNDDFPQKKDALIETLPALLNLSDNTLNYSIENLKTIDEALMSIDGDDPICVYFPRW